MPAKPNERQYRAMAVMLTPNEQRGKKQFESDYYVDGYASTFNDPYVLYEDWNGNEYREIVSPDAFENTDMSDVIMQYDHCGDVYARMSNDSLFVEPDEHGLFMAADLSLTTKSREMYEQIATGLVRCMSWAFTIDASEYDKSTRTTTITKVRKIYDVSAVSYPADPNTSISARNMLSAADGAIAELARKELARRNRAVAIAKAKIAMIERY